MWMIEYHCEIDQTLVNTITPIDLQEHLTVLDLLDMRDGKICNFVERFYDQGIWRHRFFTETKLQAVEFVTKRHSKEAWKYYFEFLQKQGYQIIGPKIEEVEVDLKNITYYF